MTGLNKIWRGSKGHLMVAFREGGSLPGATFTLRFNGPIPVAGYVGAGIDHERYVSARWGRLVA